MQAWEAELGFPAPREGVSSVIPALQRQQEEPDRRNPGLGVVGWLVSVAKPVSSRFSEVFCLKKQRGE